MSNNQTNYYSGGVGGGLSGITFIVFLVLKLTNAIDWSWWWVTSPLWIPIGLYLGILILFGLFAGIVKIFSK